MRLVKGFGGNRGLAILRVSSHRQKDNASHEVQEKEILAYARLAGIDIARMVKITESAKDSDNRAEYQEAINFALTSDIRHVLFYMYDRESRNLTDNERNEKLVRAGLLSLHYARDKKVIDQFSSDSDFFMRDINAVTNKHFLRNLSAKVADAMKAKAERGWFPGNHLPLGYAHIKDRDGEGRELRRGTTIGVDPITRNVEQAKREFELRAKGTSIEGIRRRIILDGFIPTARVARYYAGSIDRRLKNIFYGGKFLFQGRVYPGRHPLIIEPDTYQAVKRMGGKRGKNQESQFIFGGGWLKCHSCGCFISGELKKGRYVYYHCTNGRGRHEGFKKQFVREEILWDQFSSVFDLIKPSNPVASKIAEELNQSQRSAKAAHNKRLSDTRLSIENCNARELRISEDYSRGLISAEIFMRLSDKIAAEKAGLEAQENVTAIQAIETAQSILELAQNAKTIWETRNPQEKREMLAGILQNYSLDGTTIRFDLKKPFKLLSEASEKSDWRAVVDEFITLCGNAA